MANGDNLPFDDLDVIPFTAITSEWGDGIGENLLALAAGTGLDDGAVTASKLNLGALSAFTNNTGTTTSAGFTETLSGSPGTNPSVTVVIGSNGLALVTLSAALTNSSIGITRVGFAVSGANTISATTQRNLRFSGNSSDTLQASYTQLLTGLTPGSTTFTLQYATNVGTATYFNREISVIPL